MFSKVLVANRGEIAVRILRTLRKMDVASVAIYSQADCESPHVMMADEAVCVGPGPAKESYLRASRIIQVAKETRAEAIIPGYGFLSENADFAEACADNDVAFIGPTPAQIRDFGLKHRARTLAEAAKVPLVPGSGLLASADEAVTAAESIGFPVILKSTAGGGGIGMERCNSHQELIAAFDRVRRQGQSYFGDGGVFVERFVESARHVEVQIFGDGKGNVVALGERDCSLQRRNQKVVEETPAPGLPEAIRAAMLESAVNLGRSVDYRSAGTVEYIYDEARQAFYFLEVNTRLQVEHPVTELVTGVDLVEWMVGTAAGEPPILTGNVASRGAAMEVRLYAEDPARNFLPSPGRLDEVAFPRDARVDTWIAPGAEVSAHYDPLLGKLIVHGASRSEALERLREALADTYLTGIATNLEYLRQVVGSDFFAAGQVSTARLNHFIYRATDRAPVDPVILKVLQAALHRHCGTAGC
ncbi:MAG: hypothetical protein COB19_03345 [Porticoccus sp.]|nr:MAG: hypothetical protein COB19_03345 [Porticoccus sp.]